MHLFHMHSKAEAELKPDKVQECKTGHVSLDYCTATCDCANPTSAEGTTALPQQQVRCQDARIMHVAVWSHVHDMAMLSTP